MLEAERALRDLFNYEDGWSYGKGLAFDVTILNAGLHLVEYLDNIGLKLIKVIPHVEGFITLSIYKNVVMDIGVHKDFKYTFIRYDAGEVYEDLRDLDLTRLIARLQEVVK